MPNRILKTPAECVIQAFGSIRAVARLVGRDPSSVSKWRSPKENKGCGGDVPSGDIQRQLLTEAQARGLDLTENDLIWGRR